MILLLGVLLPETLDARGTYSKDASPLSVFYRNFDLRETYRNIQSAPQSRDCRLYGFFMRQKPTRKDFSSASDTSTPNVCVLRMSFLRTCQLRETHPKMHLSRMSFTRFFHLRETYHKDNFPQKFFYMEFYLRETYPKLFTSGR